jgi:hypothetical protein
MVRSATGIMLSLFINQRTQTYCKSRIIQRNDTS